MKQIEDSEFQERFDELLDEVERGATVIITATAKRWLG
jgi:antitoxin (DNA-binding transcriptional repressor) of toxin-antitoxin stability system